MRSLNVYKNSSIISKAKLNTIKAEQDKVAVNDLNLCSNNFLSFEG